mgnify:CR=1 FL=1
MAIFCWHVGRRLGNTSRFFIILTFGSFKPKEGLCLWYLHKFAGVRAGGNGGTSIFKLQDHQHDVWALEYRIKLPPMGTRRFNDQGDWCAKVVSEEGDVLVSGYGQLLHRDQKGNEMKFGSQLPVWWYPKKSSSLMRTCRWFFLIALTRVLFSIHFSEKTNKRFL